MTLYQQPQVGPFQIDTANPLAGGIGALVIGANRWEAISHKGPTASSSGPITSAAGKYGVARTFTRATGAQDIYAETGFSGDVTIFLVGGLSGQTAGTQLLFGLQAGSTQRLWLGENSNSAMSFVSAPNGGSAVSIAAGGLGDAIYVGRISGTTMTLWKNGVQVSSGTQASANWSDTNAMFIGNTAFLANPGGNVYAAGFAKRAWTDQEIANFTANPWQFIIDESDDDIFIAPGGTDTPANPLAGQGVFGGYAPSADQTANQSATPGVAAVVLIGQAPTVSQPQTSSDADGSIATSGFAPTIKQPQSSSPILGTAPLAGFAPTIVQPQATNPETGAAVFAGYSPTVSQPISVAAGAGSAVVEGFAPTISQPLNTAPGLGPTALTSFAPSVTQAANLSISVPNGTTSLSSSVPTIAQTASQSANPFNVQLSFAGPAPTVFRSGAVTANPIAGSAVATGYAPAIGQTASINVVPTPSGMVAAGYQPVLAQTSNQFVQAPSGAVSVAGQAPSVRQPITVDGATGTAASSGYSPSVDQTTGTFVQPATATAYATGFAPTINQPLAIVTGTGAAITQGFAPSVTQANAHICAPANILGNLYSQAVRIIPQVEIYHIAYTGRTQNASKQWVPNFLPPVKIWASAQSVSRNLYKQLGLDLQKSYIKVFAQKDLIDLNRDTSGDRFIFGCKLYQIQSNNNWYLIDGWLSCLAVELAIDHGE